MTVEEMLNRMSSRELTEWSCYYSLEPFGEWPQWYRAGLITSTLLMIQRAKNKNRGKKYRPEDFIPEVKESYALPAEDLKAKAKQIGMMMKANLRKENKPFQDQPKRA